MDFCAREGGTIFNYIVLGSDKPLYWNLFMFYLLTNILVTNNFSNFSLTFLHLGLTRDRTCISCASCIGQQILYQEHHLGCEPSNRIYEIDTCLAKEVKPFGVRLRNLMVEDSAPTV